LRNLQPTIVVNFIEYPVRRPHHATRLGRQQCRKHTIEDGAPPQGL